MTSQYNDIPYQMRYGNQYGCIVRVRDRNYCKTFTHFSAGHALGHACFCFCAFAQCLCALLRLFSHFQKYSQTNNSFYNNYLLPAALTALNSVWHRDSLPRITRLWFTNIYFFNFHVKSNLYLYQSSHLSLYQK